LVIDRSSDIPLYQQIKQELLRLIESQGPHTRIPSESKCAKMFQVSRGTVQQAFEELVAEDYLYRVPKSGTYVKPPIIRRHFHVLPSYSEDIRARGLCPGILLVELAKEIPNRHIAKCLNLNRDSIVWKIKRVHTANAEPVILSTSYVPTRLVPELTEDEVSVSLYKTLDSKYGSRPTWAHETYIAEKADRITASLLNTEVDTAVLKAERISYSSGGQIMEYTLSFIQGNRFEIHIDINAPSGRKESGGGV
ncbi:MAG: GntR family transcriptional regulator, partial [Clostridiales bacterium]|nr:GntR family transcriptional regulator [Clostridiales bacterium]